MRLAFRGLRRCVVPFTIAAFLVAVDVGATGSLRATAYGCNRWHPVPLTLAGYGTAVRFCESPGGRSMVVTNISSGVVRVYSPGATRLEVRADSSVQKAIVDYALGAPCSNEGQYCDLRPGRRLLATDPVLVDIRVTIPASESFDASVAAKLGGLLQTLATPRPMRFANGISSCVGNISGTLGAGTQEEQVTQAIQGASQCRSILQEIKQTAHGEAKIAPLFEPAAIAKSVMRDGWLDVAAFNIAKILRGIKR
jgi:hypothetical protein